MIGFNPYQTPDGRTVNLPPDFASKFQGLVGQPPPEPPPLDVPAPIGPLPTPGPAFVPPTVVAPTPTAEQLPATSVPAPQTPRQPVPSAPPKAPVTNAGLVQGGSASTYELESAAIDKEAAARQRAAESEADEWTKVGVEQEARNAEVDAILKGRKEESDAINATVAQRMKERERRAKEIADTKIDRQSDHPILAAIGVALAGLGSALKGQGDKNPALVALNAAIDRKVAGQVQDLDKKRGELGDYNQVTADIRAAGRDRLADLDALKLGAIEKSLRQIEAIKSKSGVQRVRDNADILSAGLEKEKAGIYGKAVEREQDKAWRESEAKRQTAQHKQSIGVQYAGLAQAAQHHKDQVQLKRDEMLLDAQKLAAQGKVAEAKAKADEAESVRKFAISAPDRAVTGPDGKPVLDKNGTPKVQSGVLVKADGSILKFRDEKVADKFANKVAVAGEVNDIINEALAIRDQVGGETETGNSNEYQRLKVLEQRLVTLAKSGVEGMSSDADMDILRGALGSKDLTSFRARAAGLESGRDRTTTMLNRELKANNYDGQELSFPNRWKVAVRTPEQSQLDDVLKGTEQQPIARLERELGVTPAGTYSPEAMKRWGGNRQQELADRLRETGGILPSQRAVLDNWSKALGSSDPKIRDRAAAFLEQAASKGNDSVRSYAGSLLQRNVKPDFGGGTPEEISIGRMR